MGKLSVTTEVAEDVYRHTFVDEEIISTRVDKLYRGTSTTGKSFIRFVKGERITISRRSGIPRIYYQRNIGTCKKPRFTGLADYTYIPERESAFRNDGRHHQLLTYFRDWYPEDIYHPSPFSTRHVTSDHSTLVNVIWDVAFPTIREAEFPKTPVPGMVQALTQPTIQGFTRKLFGDSYRKDLVKAVAQCQPAHVEMAKTFSQVLPIDYAIGFLHWAARYPPPMRVRDQKSLKNLVANFHPTTAKNLILNPHGFETPDVIGGIIADIQRDLRGDYSDLGTIKFKTWSDLHRWSIAKARDRRLVNRPISWKNERALSLPSITPEDGVSLIKPEDTFEMRQWGGVMHNCIGGYGDEAVSERGYFFAAIKDGGMVANIQLDKMGNVLQLLGRFNLKLSAAEKAPIKTMIQKAWPRANVNGGWQ